MGTGGLDVGEETEDGHVHGHTPTVAECEMATTESIGHLILVIAERIDNVIHFKIGNSLNGYTTDAAIRRVVRNIVRNCGWMDGREPRFSTERQQNVPQQMWGSNACGTHVIFDGWAYALGIRINPN